MSYQEEQDFTNERVDPKLWKRLYAYAWRNKKTFIMTIVCLLYVALADSLYPLLANYAVDSFIIPGKSDGVWLFLIMYVALAFSQGFGTLGFITRCGKMEMTISYDIRQDGFLKLQNQSFSYYDKTAVGYLMARMISDVSRLSEMVAWSMVDLLWSSCYALLCLIIMLIKNWKLALLVLVVVPPLAIVAFFMERAILKYQREARKHNSRITGAFNEGIMGAMTTKTLVYEEDNAKEFKEITGSMRKASIKAALISAAFFPLVISLGAVGTSLALYLGGKGVLDPGHAFIGEISAGTLVAFITYAASLFDPIQQFASIFADFQSAQASAERVVGLIDAPIQVQDALTAQIQSEAGADGPKGDDQREERRVDQGRFDGGLAHAPGDLPELLDVLLLIDQRLSGHRSHDALVEGAGDAAVVLARFPLVLQDGPLQKEGDNGQRRHHRQHQQRQLPVLDEHDDEAQERVAGGPEEVHHAPGHHLREPAHVADHPGHEIPHGGLVVVGEGLVLELQKPILPDVVGDGHLHHPLRADGDDHLQRHPAGCRRRWSSPSSRSG